MAELRLEGCRAEPLGSYLKALGVLRLVGDQIDANATGRWDADVFVLASALDVEALVSFFVDHYRPTPLVAPWNGRAGFRTELNRPSEQLLSELEHSVEPRLEPFRQAISAGRAVYEKATAAGWDRQKEKDLWVRTCRATFPDQVVPWLDAVVVLTSERPVFPPLLGGSGGVLGSLDLTSNFMEYLAILLRLPRRKRLTRDRVIGLSRHSLLAGSSPGLLNGVIGQFDPGGAGGINSAPLGDAGGLVNPWDFVLLLEGSLLFASGVARRLGDSVQGKAAMPFTVDSSPVGYPSGSQGETSRGEVWAPLWSRPATATEISRLVGEGRSTWRRTQARTGLDFVRATASLGVDRGIEEFVRHVFVERMGRSNIAVPVGRVSVRAKPEVPLLAQVDPWVSRVRRAKNLPNSVAAALRRLDSAQFEVSSTGGALALQEVLGAVADLEAAVARSPGLRDETRGPLVGLRAGDWLPMLDDGSPELRLAAAIASQRDFVASSAPVSPFEERCSSPALYLRAVHLSPTRRLVWSGRPPRVANQGLRPVNEVLGEVLGRRMVDVGSRSSSGDGEEGQVGVQPSFRFALRAPLVDVADLVEGTLDEVRMGRLLAGMLLLDWRHHGERVFSSGWGSVAGCLARPAQPLWALLAPFFHGYPVPVNDGDPRLLRPDANWAALLVAGQLRDVAAQALLRLRVARLDPAPASVTALSAALDPPRFASRLAAGLFCPLSSSDVSALLSRVVPGPTDQLPAEKENARAQ